MSTSLRKEVTFWGKIVTDNDLPLLAFTNQEGEMEVVS